MDVTTRMRDHWEREAIRDPYAACLNGRPEPTPRGIVSQLRACVRDWLLNSAAASPLLPCRARRWVYRRLGLDIRGRVYPRCYFGGGEVTIGAGAFVNVGCFFDTSAPVNVGTSCHLAQQVTVCTSTHEPGPNRQRAGALTSLPVQIGAGCWVGARALILPGVAIGAGCVIAAGAVVTRDCEPDGLYAGVPAERVRDLTAP